MKICFASCWNNLNMFISILEVHCLIALLQKKSQIHVHFFLSNTAVHEFILLEKPSRIKTKYQRNVHGIIGFQFPCGINEISLIYLSAFKYS